MFFCIRNNACIVTNFLAFIQGIKKLQCRKITTKHCMTVPLAPPGLHAFWISALQLQTLVSQPPWHTRFDEYAPVHRWTGLFHSSCYQVSMMHLVSERHDLPVGSIRSHRCRTGCGTKIKTKTKQSLKKLLLKYHTQELNLHSCLAL